MSRGTRELTRRVGGRVLRAGETVKVKGCRGEYSIVGFVGGEVDVYGGYRGKVKARTFEVGRIGARVRNAR